MSLFCTVLTTLYGARICHRPSWALAIPADFAEPNGAVRIEHTRISADVYRVRGRFGGTVALSTYGSAQDRCARERAACIDPRRNVRDLGPLSDMFD